MAYLTGIAVVIGALFVIALVIISIFKAFYVKVEQGVALIKNDTGNTPKVVFTGTWIIPVIHKKELMRISLITMEVDRRGKDGLICADNMRADITVAFYLRVNETPEDVLQVAKSLGASRASDKDAVHELFNAKFSEALKTVGKQIEFVKLFEDRQTFREKIKRVIGDDLNGYILEDVAIDYLEQTPKSSLDPSNILDSQGIRKITELTATQNVRTNELERDEELAIKKKNVETTEARLELERQQADAEARQQREILSIQAREEAETKRIQEEERKKSEETAIAVEQELSVQRENQQREVEVAQQNRQRAVAIEVERVSKARDLEIVAREREVELQRIGAEKDIEKERKEIANVIRERVTVDKSVAVEEEKIKEVREISEADRAKQAAVLQAEADAETEKVKQVQQAEAEGLAAKYRAEEVVTMAQAKLEAAAKDADAKKKLAEGVEAEEAAMGIAEAKVREAQAMALEKEGLAEAKVITSKGEANATALEKAGTAEANVLAFKGEAQAKAVRDTGLSEADVSREKLRAEAEGLVEKFEAMSSLSGDARDHEEFRMSLETALEEALASIEAGKVVAKENAEVLATALQNSNIDIVGGEEHFFNNFAKSLSIGKAIDGLAAKSGTVEALLHKFMSMQKPSEKSNGAAVDPQH
ncbi:MAG: hypothetical protein KTR17_12605 [Cellvibrionaceae bacterium]|nr:hypothetical protein [Cellvibrionaceae bacterium]